jgi:hypothetical protein
MKYIDEYETVEVDFAGIYQESLAEEYAENVWTEIGRKHANRTVGNVHIHRSPADVLPGQAPEFVAEHNGTTVRYNQDYADIDDLRDALPAKTPDMDIYKLLE